MVFRMFSVFLHISPRVFLVENNGKNIGRSVFSEAPDTPCVGRLGREEASSEAQGQASP